MPAAARPIIHPRKRQETRITPAPCLVHDNANPNPFSPQRFSIRRNTIQQQAQYVRLSGGSDRNSCLADQRRLLAQPAQSPNSSTWWSRST